MRWAAASSLLAVFLAAPAAAAAGSVGFEAEIGLARGPFRYEGATGEGNQATAETDFQSLALNLGAHAGFELAPDYLAGLRLGVGMLPALYARLVPDELAIISPTGTRTFAELNERGNRLARALRARGLRSGDSVALVCSNRPGSRLTSLARLV